MAGIGKGRRVAGMGERRSTVHSARNLSRDMQRRHGLHNLHEGGQDALEHFVRCRLARTRVVVVVSPCILRILGVHPGLAKLERVDSLGAGLP